MDFKHNDLTIGSLTTGLAAVLLNYSSFALAVENADSVQVSQESAAETVSEPVAVDSNNSQDGGSRDAGFKIGESSFRFPSWPDKTVSSAKDIPPPPPLGPYMSSALNADQSEKPAFAVTMPAPDMGAAAPMTTFSPDIPWPGDDAEPVKRWQPDDGYHFVAPGFMAPQPFIQRYAPANAPAAYAPDRFAHVQPSRNRADTQAGRAPNPAAFMQPPHPMMAMPNGRQAATHPVAGGQQMRNMRQSYSAPVMQRRAPPVMQNRPQNGSMTGMNHSANKPVYRGPAYNTFQSPAGRFQGMPPRWPSAPNVRNGNPQG